MKKCIVTLLTLLVFLQSCNNDDDFTECPDAGDCQFVGRQKLSVQFISEENNTDVFIAQGGGDIQVINSLVHQLSIFDVELQHFIDVIGDVDEDKVTINPIIELEGLNTFEFTLEDLIDVQLSFDREIDEDDNVLFSNFTTTASNVINDGVDNNGVTNIRLFIDNI